MSTLRRCEAILEALALSSDEPLPASVRRDVEAHLALCASCRRIASELHALATELPALSMASELRPDLPQRIAARVPCPVDHDSPLGRARRARVADAWQRMHLAELRRVASWAVVFLSAWWMLAGSSVAAFASGRVAPAARELVDVARARVDESGFVPFVVRARDGATRAGRSVQVFVFGETPGAYRPGRE